MLVPCYWTDEVYSEDIAAVLVQLVVVISRIACCIYRTPGGRLDAIGTYSWLSNTLAGVKSAENGTIRLPLLDVMCSLYPNIHPLVWLKPHLA
ncbi:hypothetical protein Ngar_c09070 [Candidatus Nitrososphaera gargensis Ga9.2]|uniref:Uncharacterized protein n=1 Tax=Nitrososphaera gargensis (strain Ga9.2) TaxID=1237085 RepID=K0IME9_NITGG|nr:hypothetical protein Ngar_c09070 [Candidatus Nitrososphaera gargensis Ga9.2]